MRIRADIAELLRVGHSDTHIAYRLGCHRNTVHRARLALRLPPSKPLGRLYAEELPTGLVGDYKPDRMPISPQQAASNWARLEAALKAAA